MINGVIRRVTEIASEQSGDWLDPSGRKSAHDRMLTHSLAYYASRQLKGPQTEPYAGRFLIGEHHLAWDELLRRPIDLQGPLLLMIMAPRDHGKTLFFSVALPIWRADRHPGELLYIFSANQTLAEERLAETRRQLEDNPKLQHLIPPGADRSRGWNVREIRLVGGTVIRARGWGVRVRGGHPDGIIGDDVVDDDSLYSQTRRERAVNYYFSAIRNMVQPTGWVALVGTPQHQADLYAKVIETGKYLHRTFKALSEDGRALFPERHSAESLRARREEIGAARFARELMCQPLTDEASLFPSKLFEGEIRQPYRLGLPWQHWEELGLARYTGVDVAMSAEVGADWFVIFTLAVSQEGVRWIANIRRHKGLGFQAQLDMLKDEFTIMRPDSIWIESNQAQVWLPQETMRTTDLPVRMFFTTGTQPRKSDWSRGVTRLAVNKHSIDRGVPSLRMSLENKKWRIPRGDHEAIEATDRWIGELGALSIEGGQVVSTGDHDDVAMACWMADVGARMGDVSSWAFPGDDKKTEAEPEKIGAITPAAVALEPEIPSDLAPDGSEEGSAFDPFGLNPA